MVIGSIKSDNPEIAGRDPGSASTLDHAPRSGLSFWTRLRSFLYGMSTVLEIWPPPGRYLANFAVSQVEPEVSEDEDEDIFDPWQIIAENLWAAILQNKDLPMALRKKYELSASLPPPELLAEFEKIIPGSAQRVFADFEALSEHRREMEREALEMEREEQQKTLEMQRQTLEGEIIDIRRGQIFGLVAGITATVCGSLTAIFGSAVAGGFIGSAGVIGLASVFVLGRYVKGSKKN